MSAHRRVERVDINGRRHLGDYAFATGFHRTRRALQARDLDETIARLATFGPIERIEATTSEEGEEVVVNLGITEKDRWAVDVGGGWNSDRGVKRTRASAMPTCSAAA